MEDTKQGAVLKCKNCLMTGHTVYTRLPFLKKVSCFLVACIAGYFSYGFLTVVYEFLKGNITGEAKNFIPLSFILLLSLTITIFGAAYFIRDLKRHDYWFFMDTFGRMHCDTVEPQYHKGSYYWQPLGTDLHLLGAEQTIAGHQFVIPSVLIHWRVGGFTRSHGTIHFYHFTMGFWVPDGDNQMTEFILRPRNSSTWQGSSITLENLNHRNAVTVPLLSFLRFTVEHGNMFNAWLSNNGLIEGIAQLLLVNAKDKSATKNYDALGRFLLQMREEASTWPENSEYAKAMRKATDEFLLTMPDDDIKAWRCLETNEITGEPEPAPNSNSQPGQVHPGPGDCIRVSMEEINSVKASLAANPSPPPEEHPRPGDAVCFSMEQIEKMRAELPPDGKE